MCIYVYMHVRTSTAHRSTMYPLTQVSVRLYTCTNLACMHTCVYMHVRTSTTHSSTMYPLTQVSVRLYTCTNLACMHTCVYMHVRTSTTHSSTMYLSEQVSVRLYTCTRIRHAYTCIFYVYTCMYIRVSVTHDSIGFAPVYTYTSAQLTPQGRIWRPKRA